MSLFSDERIEKLGVWRKYILRVAIWLLIAGVVAGVLLILLNDTKGIAEVISKTMGNIFLVAAMMVGCVLSFRLIESKKTVVQIFATICLWTGLVWGVLWSLAIWAWQPLFMVTVRDEAACAEYIQRENEYVNKYGGTKVTTCPDHYATKYEMTVLFKLTVVITIVSGFSLIAAWTMNMYEGKRKDLIRPLKIVAVSLAGYDAFYFCLMVLTNYPDGFDKMGMLAGFASSIWFLVIIVAWVISHNEKVHDRIKKQVKKDELENGEEERKTIEAATPAEIPAESVTATEEVKDTAGTAEAVAGVAVVEGTTNETTTQVATDSAAMSREPMPNELPEISMPRRKTDEELRAEIEEQVRREMIEKQVREKLEKEMEENGHL